MKIVYAEEKIPKLVALNIVKFGSAFLFHSTPDVVGGGCYCKHGSVSDPYLLTNADFPARVVNLKNGNTFCVDFYKTQVEVLKNAEVTL